MSSHPIRTEVIYQGDKQTTTSNWQKNIIEHCFGILKQMFRELFHVKLRNMQLIVHFIRAACVLHNICLDDNMDLDLVLPQDAPLIDNNEGHVEREDNEDNLDARMIRNNVCNSLEM